MIDFLRSKIDFKASRSPYETSNPDVSVRGTHAASASQTASKRKPSANIYEKGKKALDTVMMAANGNQVDTGVANQVYEKINEYFQSTEKIIW